MPVDVANDGPVRIITNNRPEARNAVSPEQADALKAAFDAFEADDSARVAVFTGADGAFCGGWDLKYAATLTDPADFDRDLRQNLAFPEDDTSGPRGPMGPSRMEFSKPVIAAVEGPAVAGGMELAMLALSLIHI